MNCTIPALVSSRVGSTGINDELGTTMCPRSSKKPENVRLIELLSGMSGQITPGQISPATFLPATSAGQFLAPVFQAKPFGRISLGGWQGGRFSRVAYSEVSGPASGPTSNWASRLSRTSGRSSMPSSLSWSSATRLGDSVSGSSPDWVLGNGITSRILGSF